MNRYLVILLLLLSFIAAIFNSWQDKIFFTDELFVEDAAYIMSRGGSFIIPKVNGEPYLAKPPLLYWLYAPLYIFFQPTPFISRIWMTVFGVLLTLVVYKLAEKWFGVKTAIYSSLFLTSSFPFIYFTEESA